ncbi:MAG: hypothetical protein ABI472_03480 [Ginsengibacter sp.]
MHFNILPGRGVTFSKGVTSVAEDYHYSSASFYLVAQMILKC